MRHVDDPGPFGPADHSRLRRGQLRRDRGPRWGRRVDPRARGCVARLLRPGWARRPLGAHRLGRTEIIEAHVGRTGGESDAIGPGIRRNGRRGPTPHWPERLQLHSGGVVPGGWRIRCRRRVLLRGDVLPDQVGRESIVRWLRWARRGRRRCGVLPLGAVHLCRARASATLQRSGPASTGDYARR